MLRIDRSRGFFRNSFTFHAADSEIKLKRTDGAGQYLRIAREITRFLAVLGVWAWAVACGSPVVDLGTVGGRLAGASGVPAAIGGVGGAATSDAGVRTTGGAGAGAAAGGGAGSAAGIMASAGASAPPDAAVIDTTLEPSPGCGTQPSASDTIVTVGGASASFIVDLASGYDRNRPYPLVISLRGANVTAEAFRHYLDLPAVVGADGIVVNMDCANGAGTWDLQRDLPLFDALLVKLKTNYCIDQKRVFIVGHATGAIFANSLACMRGAMLRGLGSLSGSTPSGTCEVPLAVWISQGNADMSITMGRADREFWLRQNQCTAGLTMPVDPTPCLEYTGCKLGSPVRYCEYDGTLDLPSFVAAGVWGFFKAL
jgi:poly(3-hydroxybutyrate) depolymerase